MINDNGALFGWTDIIITHGVFGEVLSVIDFHAGEACIINPGGKWRDD
jgi:hypothetical protein